MKRLEEINRQLEHIEIEAQSDFYRVVSQRRVFTVLQNLIFLQ